MSRYRKGAGGKRDENEPAIIKVLRAHGCVVWPLSGKGIPDLLVMRKGKKWLADVKMLGRPTTKPQEDAWEEAATKANVSVFILRTPEDATKMLNNALEPWEPAEPKRLSPSHSCKNCEGIQPETCLVNPHRIPRKSDAAKARTEGRKRLDFERDAVTGLPAAYYTPPRSTPVDAAKEAEVFAPPATGDFTPCTRTGCESIRRRGGTPTGA